MTETHNGKSLLRTAVEGGAVVFSGGIFLKAIGVLSTIVILNYVTVYDYGVWRLVLSVFGFMSVLTIPILENVVISDASREISRKNSSYSSIIVDSSKLILILNLVACLSLFFLSQFVTKLSGIDLSLLLKIVALSFLFVPLKRIYNLVFNIKLFFGHIQTFSVISRCSFLIAIIAFLAFGKISILALAISHTISYAVPVVFYAPFFLKHFLPILKESKYVKFSLWDSLREHGIWAFLTNQVDSALVAASPWIIGYFIGIEALAVIMVAKTLFGEIVNTFPVSQILAPIIPRHVDFSDKFQNIFSKSLKYSIWLYACFGFLIVFVAPFFIELFFPQYVSSISLFQLLAISLVALPFNTVTTHTFYALKKQKSLFFSTSIPRFLMTVVALPLLLLFFGANGAIFEQILSVFFVAVARFLTIKRVINVDFSLSHVFKIEKEDVVYLKRIFLSFKKFLKRKFV